MTEKNINKVSKLALEKYSEDVKQELDLFKQIIEISIKVSIKVLTLVFQKWV